MELQTAFYIVGIIFMGLMLILFVVLLVAVLVIKAKINKVHAQIESKIEKAKNIASKASVGLKAARYFTKK